MSLFNLVSHHGYFSKVEWNVAWLCESLKSGNQTKRGTALALRRLRVYHLYGNYAAV